MILRNEGFLKARDMRIHEASHLFLGRLFKIPVTHAEVFENGTGGLTHIDQDRVTQSAATVADDDIPPTLQRQAAMNIAGLFLCGHAGEAIACGVNLDYIIGVHTDDYSRAHEVVEKFLDHPSEIEIAWHRCCRILIENWQSVLDLAATIPITSGSHRAPELY